MDFYQTIPYDRPNQLAEAAVLAMVRVDFDGERSFKMRARANFQKHILCNKYRLKLEEFLVELTADDLDNDFNHAELSTQSHVEAEVALPIQDATVTTSHVRSDNAEARILQLDFSRGNYPLKSVRVTTRVTDDFDHGQLFAKAVKKAVREVQNGIV